MISQYAYTAIMDQLEYDHESGEWVLPSRCIKGFETDQTLRFGSRFAAHEFVYNSLKQESA